jgi:hypothetical protein
MTCRGKWNSETRKIAHDLRAAGATIDEVAGVVAMSASSVKQELHGIPRGGLKPELPPCQPQTYIKHVSDAQISERDQRRAAADRRDFTGAFFGDPPPGYSELDKKRAHR